MMKSCMFGIKKCFQENVMLELGVREKNFVRLLMSLMALEDLFGTQGIHRIKRGGRTMRESISMPPNVSWWRFFDFEGLRKPFWRIFNQKLKIFEIFEKSTFEKCGIIMRCTYQIMIK